MNKYKNGWGAIEYIERVSTNAGGENENEGESESDSNASWIAYVKLNCYFFFFRMKTK